MDVEILEFKLKADARKLGTILIRYHELEMKCELVYNRKDDRMWVRMPEVWLTPEKKVSYCHWPNRTISDKFQKEVLNKLQENYRVEFKEIKDLHVQQVRAYKLGRQNLQK